MGCLTVTARRVDGGMKVSATRIDALNVSVTVLPHAKVSAELVRPKITVTASRVPTIKVNVSLVCSVAVSDEVEMWFADGWKALWNNKKKMLWHKESV